VGTRNGWQYPSKVSLQVRGLRGDHRSGAHGQSFVAAVPAPEPFIVRDAGSEAPRVIHVSKMPGAGVDEDQRRRPFAVGRGEEHGHLTAVGVPEERRPLRARGIHDRADVVRPLLQRRHRGQRHRVRDARPALVEAEEPAEGREAAKKTRDRRLLPHHVDIARPVEDEHQIQRAVPDDLIGDIAVLAPGVLRLGLHGPQLVPSRPPVNGAGAADLEATDTRRCPCSVARA